MSTPRLDLEMHARPPADEELLTAVDVLTWLASSPDATYEQSSAAGVARAALRNALQARRAPS